LRLESNLEFDQSKERKPISFNELYFDWSNSDPISILICSLILSVSHYILAAFLLRDTNRHRLRHSSSLSQLNGTRYIQNV